MYAVKKYPDTGRKKSSERVIEPNFDRTRKNRLCSSHFCQTFLEKSRAVHTHKGTQHTVEETSPSVPPTDTGTSRFTQRPIPRSSIPLGFFTVTYLVKNRTVTKAKSRYFQLISITLVLLVIVGVLDVHLP